MDILSRRKFLAASGVVGAGALVAGADLGWHQLNEAAATRPHAAGDGILVVVTLYGGNDGLNMIAPVGDAAYHSARPDFALTAEESLPLADGLSINKAMPQLKKAWDAKTLTVVRGVGYPDPSLSHFQSMDIWQTASPTSPTTTGWLGRWLDSTGTDPVRALATDTVLPPMLAGARSSGATVPGGSLKLPRSSFADALFAMDTTSTLTVSSDAEVTMGDVRQSGLDLRTVAGIVDPALGSSGASGVAGGGSGSGGDPGAADANSLAGQLDVVAKLVAAGLPTRVYCASLGGFDSHSAEKTSITKLLGDLDTALGSFTAALAKTPHGRDVTVMVHTEFGRRVQANASEGTDHGTANPVLVLGDHVRGGFVGDQPSLTDLVEGNLKVTTDFRAIYATLLEGVIGGDVGQVLGPDVAKMARLPILT